MVPAARLELALFLIRSQVVSPIDRRWVCKRSMSGPRAKTLTWNAAFGGPHDLQFHHARMVSDAGREPALAALKERSPALDESDRDGAAREIELSLCAYSAHTLLSVSGMVPSLGVAPSPPPFQGGASTELACSARNGGLRGDPTRRRPLKRRLHRH